MTDQYSMQSRDKKLSVIFGYQTNSGADIVFFCLKVGWSYTQRKKMTAIYLFIYLFVFICDLNYIFSANSIQNVVNNAKGYICLLNQ